MHLGLAVGLAIAAAFAGGLVWSVGDHGLGVLTALVGLAAIGGADFTVVVRA